MGLPSSLDRATFNAIIFDLRRGPLNGAPKLDRKGIYTMRMKKWLIALVIGGLAFAWGAAQAQEAEAPHFHHVHVNAVDPAKSIAYYQKFFGAVPVKFRGKSDAVLTDRSFILFNKVDEPAPWEMISGLYHVGWGGYDGPSDYKWRDEAGMEWQTELSSLGTNHYMYAFGPDKEVIEVWTGFKHHRFGHIHLFSDDVGIAHDWYMKNLGTNGPAHATPKPPKPPADFDAGAVSMNVFRYLWSSQVSTNNGVAINIFATPSTKTVNWWADPPIDEPLVPSDGRAIDHIAFSYRDIQPVYDRMKKNGVEIVDEIKMREEFGMKSFFVRGPDKVLIEIVEGKPVPEGVWE